MASFELLFPTFIEKCAELHTLLQVVAFLLFVVGTILLAAERFTARRLLGHLVRLTVLISLMLMLPSWGNAAQEILHGSIIEGLGVDPARVHEEYNRLLVTRRNLGTGSAWWDLIGRLGGFSVEALVTGALWLVGHAASLLLFWACIFQKVILFVGYALAPLLIGLMAIAPLRHIGSRYLLNLVGVLLWPLGWGVAALITQGFLDFMTDPSIRFWDPTSGLYHVQATFGMAALAVWVAFSTVAAPAMIQRVFSHGVLAASRLLSHFAGTGIQMSATAAAAGAVASPAGLPLLTAGAAGMAAVLSTLSGAAGHGSAGAIIVAGSGLPPRSARGRPGDDISGDRAVRELLTRRATPQP